MHDERVMLFVSKAVAAQAYIPYTSIHFFFNHPPYPFTPSELNPPNSLVFLSGEEKPSKKSKKLKRRERKRRAEEGCVAARRLHGRVWCGGPVSSIAGVWSVRRRGLPWQEIWWHLPHRHSSTFYFSVLTRSINLLCSAAFTSINSFIWMKETEC